MEVAEFDWWEQEIRIYAEDLGRNVSWGGECGKAMQLHVINAEPPISLKSLR